MIKTKVKLTGLLIMVIIAVVFSGCTQSDNAILDKTAFATDLTKLTVSENVRIVGLGEASHGSSEFQQLKGEVFK
ncbi:MAG: erythromycin esterase family protein, partial [Clostridiales bacterium]|nr:erythromycin esterase family protein [Clostridiales bacterium]